MHKAVILGSNYYIGLSVIRCLGANRIHTVAMDYSKEHAYAAKSKYLNEHFVVPHYRDQEQALLASMIEYAKRQERPPVLFPCADPYVEFVDKHLDELRPYYSITMSERGLWSKVMDKDALHEMASALGVRVPETASPSEADFEERVVREIGFPCIVKPADSASFVAKFRVKMFKCKDLAELRAAVDKAKAENLHVVAQRIVPGFDDHMYTYDAYLNQNAKVTHWMTCQKLRQYPINFGASTYTKQKYVQELHDIGAPFLEGIRYKGFAEIEFKKDEKSGAFYLIEVNVRTTTLNTLLDKCGINFPLLAYRELTGKEIGEFALKRDIGLAFRYWFEDRITIRNYRKTNQLTRLQVWKSLLARKAPAVWSAKDPMPALYFLLMLAKKAKKKLSLSR